MVVVAGAPRFGHAAQAVPRPLALAEALRLAHEHNLDLRIIDAQLGQLAAEVRISLAQVLPSAALSTTYSRNDEAVRLGEAAVVERDEVVTRGEAVIGLFRPAALRSYLAQERSFEASRADASYARDTVTLTVVELYLAALRAQALADTAAEAITRRTAFAAAAARRLAAGLTNRSEVQRARLSLLEAQAEHERARSEASLARQALAVVLALPAATPLELAATNVEPPGGGAAQVPPAEDDAALAARGDVRAANLLLRRDALAKTFAWLSFLPELELAGGLTRGPTSFQDPDGVAWQVQLRATLPLYDGGARYGVLDFETATAALHEAELARTVDRARQEISAATTRLAAAARQRQTAEEALGIAGQYRDDTVRRLEAGTATTLDVLDAEVQLFVNEARLHTTQHDVWLSQWQLLHARGALSSVIAMLLHSDDRKGR